ncbi:MAG TPA: DUF2630 family protein [Kineosporiaceae bacterium]
MHDREILDCIHALIAQQRRLRDQRDAGQLGEGQEQNRLAEIGENLDEMWALLRRRRALRNAGLDPESLELRSSVQATA